MPDFKRFSMHLVRVITRQGEHFQARFLRQNGDWISLAEKTRDADCFLRISEISSIKLAERPPSPPKKKGDPPAEMNGQKKEELPEGKETDVPSDHAGRY